MVEKTCDTCGDIFYPNHNNRYKDCSSCVYKRKRCNSCPACGSQKLKVSALCKECVKGPEPVLNSMSKEQVAWLAGLLDGEGSFLVRKNTGCIKIEMTDKDVLLRLQEIIGVGNVSKTRKRISHYKQSWTWNTGRKNTVQQLIILVYPWLSARRKQQIQRIKFVQEATFQNILVESEQNFAPSEDEMFAWLAGHLEGEGYFGEKRISSVSIDIDTITRVANVFKQPVRISRPSDNKSLQTIFEVSVGKADDVVYIINRILPFLLSRRTVQANELLIRKQKVIHTRETTITYKVGDSKPCIICNTIFVVAKNDISYCRPCLYKKGMSAKTPCPGCGGIMSRYAQQCSVCASGGKRSPSQLSQL